MPESRRPPIATRVGGDDDVPVVVAALAEAFASDPVLSFLLDEGPDHEPGRHMALITALFANRLLGGRGVDEIVVPGDPADAREAAAVWVPPRGPDDPGPDYSAVGMVNQMALGEEEMARRLEAMMPKIGRASCRERVLRLV